MIHAVIDTNVLVSALLTSKSDAATVQVLEAIMNGQIIPLYNEEIISEYEIVLKSRKLKCNSFAAPDCCFDNMSMLTFVTKTKAYESV